MFVLFASVRREVCTSLTGTGPKDLDLMKKGIISSEKMINSVNYINDYGRSFFQKGFLIQCAMLEIYMHTVFSVIIQLFSVIFSVIFQNKNRPSKTNFIGTGFET